MTVVVVVTLMDDPRVVDTLASLDAQTPRPDAVLVADGGSKDGSREAADAFAASRPWVRVEVLPGTVAGTRDLAIGRTTEDVVVFLDADQRAPPGWLAALLVALDGGADFAGGPTRPPGPARSAVEDYLNRFEAWFYPEVVARDVAYLPMGNSAWRRTVFERIGSFDPRLAWGGEDYDVNLRALAAGFRGAFVPEAWVVHDQSRLRRLRPLLRKRYRYMVGATVAYLKHGSLARRAGRAVATSARFRHRYQAFDLVLKPAALVHGWVAWRRMGAPRPR
ncbi:MAG TPA: glycosyltransferase [Candidatus Thermoplasmatota archaeon]|nr:glycosyltransferase [Candidatus Thermoplasmatota archaeon]